MTDKHSVSNFVPLLPICATMPNFMLIGQIDGGMAVF